MTSPGPIVRPVLQPADRLRTGRAANPALPRVRRRHWLLALGTAAWWPAVQAATPGEVLVGQTLREARMQGLNGPTRALSSYRGKPLIINVWASWCGPCREEMASLERLAWGDLSDRFALIGISTDDYRERALAYLRHANATISHYIDQKLELENMLGAAQLPLTLLVDAKGQVLAKVSGARPWDGPEARRLIVQAFGLDKAVPGPSKGREAPRTGSAATRSSG